MDNVNKIFWSDPYLTSLRTRVSSVSEDTVTLEDTLFFAFSGGQESDHGTIDSFTVLEAKKEEHQIFYKLEKNHQITSGSEVLVQIDWARRYQLMRLHFAAELVLELFYKKFSKIEKIGAHIAADKARIDFKWNENFSSHLIDLQSAANQMVKADYDIISSFEDRKTERRYW